MSPQTAALLADLLLALHAGIAAFVVLMTLAVVAGGPLGWRWVRRRTPRLVHLALVAVIALQAWLGRLCPLTIWEQQLRNIAGQATYGESFIQHWLSRMLFFEAPWWLFVAAYSLLALLVVLGWWRWPPRPGPDVADATPADRR
ncbi:DUF2784 domain-containing protein [Luteimonas sp. BDR2-5]|uniref:DUF2784 domain-containing protein n=1 Tax=Proluteimonas luteida TaxID=2878685 RepID=UPI001E4CDB1A|nr:DUF2784 domain-containing protein [Luteimonas sp. BDR2-5]MCD9028185.1 DUF2784 domain-containing protein [Luteimonas sp. BDR2-5]